MTDGHTDRQTNTVLRGSRSRCRKRRLSNHNYLKSHARSCCCAGEGVDQAVNTNIRRTDFYSAMLCVSADYAGARCLSVCLFVIRRYCVETTKHIITILVFFPTKPYGNILTGTPLMGHRMQGVWNIAIFDQCIALSLKWYTVGPWHYGASIGNHTQSIGWCALSNDLRWPWVT